VGSGGAASEESGWVWGGGFKQWIKETCRENERSTGQGHPCSCQKRFTSKGIKRLDMGRKVGRLGWKEGERVLFCRCF